MRSLTGQSAPVAETVTLGIAAALTGVAIGMPFNRLNNGCCGAAATAAAVPLQRLLRCRCNG